MASPVTRPDARAPDTSLPLPPHSSGPTASASSSQGPSACEAFVVPEQSEGGALPPSGGAGAGRQPAEHMQSSGSFGDEALPDQEAAPVLWWQDALPFYDTYSLHWEKDVLRELGKCVQDLVASVGQQAALEVRDPPSCAVSLCRRLAAPGASLHLGLGLHCGSNPGQRARVAPHYRASESLLGAKPP
jgi:hypothetical protein